MRSIAGCKPVRLLVRSFQVRFVFASVHCSIISSTTSRIFLSLPATAALKRLCSSASMLTVSLERSASGSLKLDDTEGAVGAVVAVGICPFGPSCGTAFALGLLLLWGCSCNQRLCDLVHDVGITFIVTRGGSECRADSFLHCYDCVEARRFVAVECSFCVLQNQ